MCIQQCTEVVKQPRHGRDQHRRRAFFPRHGDIARQELAVVGIRISEARRVFGLGIVVAELDQQHITGLQLLADGIQPPFVDEAARAAPTNRVIAHLPLRRVQPALQRLPPTGLRRALRAVGRSGGIGGDEDAVGGFVCAGICGKRTQRDEEDGRNFHALRLL
ncbi:hypothetical protein D3C81_1022970 [compost metagenome]